MLKIGKRYLVLEDMFSVAGDQLCEANLPDEAFSGLQFNMCLTRSDILRLINNLTDKLKEERTKINKGDIIEILNIEYVCGRMTYVEFQVYFKPHPDAKGYHVIQNPYGWNYIREELLKKVKNESKSN